MAISSEMVKALREKTGLPMMECKKALEEAKGDTKLAEELLRKKGHSQLAKRAGRETAHGRIGCHIDAGTGRAALVELLCETEPVAGTEDFLKLTKAAAQVAAQVEAATPEAVLAQPMPGNPSQKVGDFLHDVVNRIRENIKIGRVGVVTGNVAHYLHHDGRKGVLVEFSGPCSSAADVCMHVVAMRPSYTRREEVDPGLVEQERKLATEQVQGKPANIIDKIVSGKLDRWYSEFVLLDQPFVKDDKKSVGQFLRGIEPGLTVKRFVRFEIGES